MVIKLIELVGDIKVKIEADNEEEPWEEIVDETKVNEEINNIDNEVKEEFINDNSIQ